MLHFLRIISISWLVILCLAPSSVAGNKKIMSTRAAKALAERALVETVYGMKVRSNEEVVNMVAAGFIGKTESKTVVDINGVTISELIYDEEKDIAKATAEITLGAFTNIDGLEMNFENRTFRRVAFATSTPAVATAIQALRAAEIDAYKQLAQIIVGFTLESKTTVENYILTSDVVKTKVLATTYLANISDYGWDKDGNAYVKMSVNIPEIETIIGMNIENVADLIEVEGQGAQEDSFKGGKQ